MSFFNPSQGGISSWHSECKVAFPLPATSLYFASHVPPPPLLPRCPPQALVGTDVPAARTKVPVLPWSAWMITQQGRGKVTGIWFSTRPWEQLCWHSTTSRSSPCTPPSAHCFQAERVSQCHRKATLPTSTLGPHAIVPPSGSTWVEGTELAKLTVPKSSFLWVSFSCLMHHRIRQAPVPVQSLLVKSGVSVVLPCHTRVPARCHVPLCVQGHLEIPCLRLLTVFCLLSLFTTCSYPAWLTEKSDFDSGVAL